ncbi:hypothetical protein [Paraburkholderia phytofirmans]|uniref:Uncharacterized protein n=1 Tax=Paraburkholderia phytofirmans TaxID=261302 RepID=A0ABW9BFH7_9BURK
MGHEKAASILVAAGRQGTQGERPPVKLRPSTIDEGFAIQRNAGDVLERGVGVWKCALTAVGKVKSAPIYADLTCRSGECSFSVSSVQSSLKAEPTWPVM